MSGASNFFQKKENGYLSISFDPTRNFFDKDRLKPTALK